MGLSSIFSRHPLTDNQKRLEELKTHKTLLEKTNISNLSDDQITQFVQQVLSWYPAYEHYGEKTYNESSIFWRAATYTKLTGFDTYTKLGKETSATDMSQFKVFLEKDISKEIKFLSRRIDNLQSTINTQQTK